MNFTSSLNVERMTFNAKSFLNQLQMKLSHSVQCTRNKSSLLPLNREYKAGARSC